MMHVMLTTAAMALLFITSSSSSTRMRLLAEAEAEAMELSPEGRRLISVTYTFNDKLCVNYGGWDWLTPYGGDYTYIGIENNKPSYKMKTCQDANNCNINALLNAGSNGQWQFGSQTHDPHCQMVSDKPQQCSEWWGGRTPTITECGNTQSVTIDNGLTEEEDAAKKACEAVVAESKRTFLTESDKNELLRQFNVQRSLHGRPVWTWSTALEMVSSTVSSYCRMDHLVISGQEKTDICKQYGGGDECWKAGWEGLIGGDGVNGILWDGYKYGDCNGNKGVVWSFMQDDHRRPMTGEDEDEHGVEFKHVACGYTHCGGNGIMACNYM